jgi:hypothetical protein
MADLEGAAELISRRRRRRFALALRLSEFDQVEGWQAGARPRSLDQLTPFLAGGPFEVVEYFADRLAAALEEGCRQHPACDVALFALEHAPRVVQHVEDRLIGIATMGDTELPAHRGYSSSGMARSASSSMALSKVIHCEPLAQIDSAPSPDTRVQPASCSSSSPAWR